MIVYLNITKKKEGPYRDRFVTNQRISIDFLVRSTICSMKSIFSIGFRRLSIDNIANNTTK